jgi:hypothetical protein
VQQHQQQQRRNPGLTLSVSVVSAGGGGSDWLQSGPLVSSRRAFAAFQLEARGSTARHSAAQHALA